MELVNERIIVEENSINEMLVELEERIKEIFQELGFDKSIEVEYEEGISEDDEHFFDLISISAEHFYIDFLTETGNVHLVKENGFFKFYYAFRSCSEAITNPETWEHLENFTGKEITAEKMVLAKLFG